MGTGSGSSVTATGASTGGTTGGAASPSPGGATVFKSKGSLSVVGRLIFKGEGLEHPVHLEEEFSHHGPQRDLGRFARRPQVRVKFPQRGFLHPRQHHRAHVEGPAHRPPPAPDGPLAFPRAALPHPRRQTGQRRGFLAG